jgi:hypothetical protein
MPETTNTSNCKHDQGTALVELAYILPLMVLILMSLIDVGNILNQYLRITQAVQEGVRLASSLPDLEPTSYNPGSAAARHTLVQERVRQLIQLQNIKVDQVTVDSTFTPAAPLPADPTQANTVSIRIEGRYQSVFPMFGNLRLAARGVAPYLYRQAAAGGASAPGTAAAAAASATAAAKKQG